MMCGVMWAQRHDGAVTDLEPERVKGVPSLEEENKNHAVRELAGADVLLASAGDVEQIPTDDSGPDFVEGLEVERGKAWESGVKWTAKEPLPSEAAHDTLGGEGRISGSEAET